ncbi:M15 family metallopeptidase [Winogradskyella endarachnes]|uniref:D-alanyl-D-alanine carboxypeptidase family protein n=1 Tax=Winogradskyella endarachnes TaxID=2681965 RepID=A0A6L6U7V5_9FLAO|nr:M15 family metallopeptidase [Winogradskyella endarachnes]MUU78411.1 D-alanyl-D-alanine carboxypeptidase family protein [Winogradskyella endarachnes]
MKLLLATFFMLCLVVSCNTKPNKVVVAEVATSSNDSLQTKEKSKLNINKSLVLGKFNYKTDSTFIKVSTDHSAKTLYLNKDVYAAFLDMYKAAKKDQIDLVILSGTRNFKEQKAIWERKWKKYNNLKPLDRAQKILEYSSMPSTSRHHWGTDLDLNNLTNSYFSTAKGKAIYRWLNENANDYGFYQVYTTKDNGRTGYNLEKWHWSYLPLASKYLEFYNSNITLDDIIDFDGAELAKDLNVIENYVNGISKKATAYK